MFWTRRLLALVPQPPARAMATEAAAVVVETAAANPSARHRVAVDRLECLIRSKVSPLVSQLHPQSTTMITS